MIHREERKDREEKTGENLGKYALKFDLIRFGAAINNDFIFFVIVAVFKVMGFN